MTGPVPADDDLLVLRFKRHPDTEDNFALHMWAAAPIGRDEFLDFLRWTVQQVEHGTLVRTDTGATGWKTP